MLKASGYSTYKMRKEKVLSESTIQKIREHKIPSLETLNWICHTLNVQPSDIMEYVEDKNNKS